MRKKIYKILALGLSLTLVTLPTISFSNTNTVVLSVYANDAGFESQMPEITPTGIVENDAVPGAVIATLSMPDGDDSVTYEFHSELGSGMDEVLKKYTDMLTIEGNKIKIKDDLTIEKVHPDIREKLVSKHNYNDNKLHLCGSSDGKEYYGILFMAVRAIKGDEHSDIKYNFDKTSFKGGLLIGERVKRADSLVSNNKDAFNVEEFYYYVGEKESLPADSDEWVKVDDSEALKINTTDGGATDKMSETLGIVREETGREISKKQILFKVKTNKESGPAFIGADRSNPLIYNVTSKANINAREVTFDVLTLNNKNFYRPLDIKIYLGVKPVNELKNNPFKVMAEDNVIKPGSILKVKDMNHDREMEVRTLLGDKISEGKNAKFYNVSFEAQGKEYMETEKHLNVFVDAPIGISSKNMKIYYINESEVKELSDLEQHKKVYKFTTSKLGEFVIVGDMDDSEVAFVFDEFDIEKHSPIITPVDSLKEDEAKAGTTIATLSMPSEYEGDAPKNYILDSMGDNELLDKYHELLEIQGTEIKIRHDLDTATLSKEASELIKTYPDSTKRIKANKNLLLQVIAVDNDDLYSNPSKNYGEDKIGNITISASETEEVVSPNVVDKTNLQKQVDRLNNLMDSEDYKKATDESKKEIEELLKSAKTLLDKADATQEEVDSLTKELEAFELQYIPEEGEDNENEENQPVESINTLPLEMSINKLNTIKDGDKKLTDESLEELYKLLAYAYSVMSDESAKQEDYDDAVAEIKKFVPVFKEEPSNSGKEDNEKTQDSKKDGKELPKTGVPFAVAFGALSFISLAGVVLTSKKRK